MGFVVRQLVRTGALAAALLVAGCQPGSSLPATPEESDSPQSVQPAIESTTWDAIYLHGQPVGWQSLQLTERTEAGRTSRDGRLRSVLKVQRFGEQTTEELQLTSREADAGRLESFQALLGTGPEPSETIGRRVGSELHLQAAQGQNARKWTVPLAEDCGGFFAVEWSLRERPLVPSESRKLRAFVPLLYQEARVELQASADYQELGSNGKTVKVLSVDQTLHLPGQPPLLSRLWMDGEGAIWKTEIPLLSQTTLRMAEAEAKQLADDNSFDLGTLSTIRVSPAILRPRETKRVRYRLQCDLAGALERIPETAYQKIQPISSQMIEVTVDATEIGVRSDSTDEPSEDDRQASAMIESDDPLVRELAQQFPFDDNDSAVNRALAIEKWVHSAIQRKDFSTAFASAAEVARSRQGDCTEHAVLTAALCRAAGLPARVLVGLIYVPTEEGFAFHMWNEVWVGDHWRPLDSTLGLGHLGAAHLVLVRTSLATESTWSALMPVASLLGRLRIDVLEVDPGVL